jgi:hypothetical protein
MKTRTAAHTEDEIRTELRTRGLKEEPKPIEYGYAFTNFKDPAAAVTFYEEQFQRYPTRFFVTQRSYTLSD